MKTPLKRTRSPAPASPIDQHPFPRTYEFARFDRWLTIALMGILAAFGIGFAGIRPLAPTLDSALSLTLAAFFIGVAVWTAAAALRMRIVLLADGFDYRGAFASRSVADDEVLGWARPTLGGRGIEIRLKPGRGRKILLNDSVKRDVLFERWLARFPNLDELERAASLARVLDDCTLGATPEDVAVRLKRAVMLARIGAVVALFSLLETTFARRWWTTDAGVALALALPLLALLASVFARGLVVLRPTRNDARPSLFLMLTLPIFGPILRLATQANLQGAKMLVPGALMLAVLGVVLACTRMSSPRKTIPMVGVWLCMGIVGAACVAWLNVWFDRMPVQTVPVTVTARAGVRGPAWRVDVGPTAAYPQGRVVAISYPDYAALRIGDTACLADHPGLFGLRWAELHRCPILAPH